MKSVCYSIRKKAEKASERFAVSKWKTGTPLCIGFQYFYGPGSFQCLSSAEGKSNDGIPHWSVRSECPA